MAVNLSAGATVQGRRVPCASLLSGLLAILAFWLPQAGEALQFNRHAILKGQIWRLLTGHWTHFSVDHLFWDALVFALLGVICERRSRAKFLATVFGSALAISIFLLACQHEVEIYRGLSGIDSEPEQELLRL